MVRAISEIDDDLISDVHTVEENRVVLWKKLGTLAAGLVLIISAGFLFTPGAEITVSVFGQKLTAQPVMVEQADQGAGIRAYSLEPVTVFTVPLEVKVSGHTAIKISGGSMQVFDSEGSSLLYEGEAFDAEEDVRIFWNVEDAGTPVRYEMSVEGKKTADTVILTWEDGEWKIRRAGS